MSEPRGWYSRGYLPHYDAGAVPVFLTWRLADSLPLAVYEAIQREAAKLGEKEGRSHRYRETEAYLDACHGSCLLREPFLARIVQETLLYDHGRRYDLHAWVVMPNHVHMLLTPIKGVALALITRTIKGLSSRRIQSLRGTSGRLWQPECFDRTIRDQEHFEKTARYIEWNPVKAKLCSDPKLFAYSSAYPDNVARLSGG
jgi:REP element-mobilizing transposase RayT